MPKKRKPKRIKLATAKQLSEQLAWATRIIKMQQEEIDRLMRQVDKLTEAVGNVARRD